MDKNLSPEEEELQRLAQDIEILRVRYEQYFMGIERLQPVVLRGKVNKAIIKSKLGTVRQAAIRFRFTRLVQKFRTYESMWERILREIESGKRKREFGKGMKAHHQQNRYLRAEGSATNKHDKEILARMSQDKTRTTDDVSTLYKDFIGARKRLGLDTIMDESTFRRKVENLNKKTKGLSVQVRNGRVVLVGKKNPNKDRQ